MHGHQEMRMAARGLLIVFQYVSAFLALLFAFAFVFALVTFGAVIWWQPLSFVLFGALAYGSRQLGKRFAVQPDLSTRRVE